MIRSTMLFTYRSGLGRPGGWSESWYYDSDLPNAVPPLRDLALHRAGMLPNSVKITGFRFSELGGRSSSMSVSMPGCLHSSQDIPQMAALCIVGGQGVPNTKNFTLRGIADTSVSLGDADFTAPMQAAMTTFGFKLSANNFKFRARKLSNPSIGVLSIAVDGTFSLLGDLTFNQGDFLTLLRCKATNGKPIAGNFYVGVKTDARNGKFANWPNLQVAQIGSVRKLEYIFPIVAVNSFAFKKIVTRKIGRPFDAYHGRARRK